MDLKPALTIEEQIQLLRSRGLIISSTEETSAFLSSNQYYRLNIYFHKFQDHPDHFIDQTSIYQIIRHYLHDRWLRNTLLLLLEKIEVKAKTQIAYYLGTQYGSDAFYQKNLYKVKTFHDQLIAVFEQETNRNKKDPVILHHYQKYAGKFPVWVVVEYLSFNSISKLFSNLQEKDKIRISREGYDLHETFLENWLHVLSVLRNICAHYGYLFRRDYSVRPKIARASGWDENKNNELFAQLLIIRKLTEANTWNRFIEKLEKRSQLDDCLQLSDYGFPTNWKTYLL
jgi:abortive infection bacteriophage resistance protein